LLARVRAVAGARTVFMVSHRLSSVRFADQILVLRHGRLIEHGSHADLLSAGGHYAELFQLQAGAYRYAAEINDADSGGTS
jgi:ABC-type multidrug transport system fused ATPase/permease subunit